MCLHFGSFLNTLFGYKIAILHAYTRLGYKDTLDIFVYKTNLIEKYFTRRKTDNISIKMATDKV